MDQKINEKMTKLCRKIVHVNIKKWSILDKVSINFRQFFRFIWDKILICSTGKQSSSGGHHHNYLYSRLATRPASPLEGGDEVVVSRRGLSWSGSNGGHDTDSDLVVLKISLLGDSQIGKTSFVNKYVGDEEEKKCIQMKGLNLIDKTLFVQDARIAFTIWDVGGEPSCVDHVPIACKDAVAIFFMFDLTSRCTLNSIISWYAQARKWNQTAIPILIGTKFDDFVRLPPDLQWTIVTQARTYAKAMKATLFFSSATHNINVNKIFKFIMAKLFNLPWTVERNLNIGEPIIDF